MSNFIQTFINYLNELSGVVPLPVFTFFGALIEEIIAPIPSPVVITLAGSLAAVANYSFIYLILLALTGSVGKTIGAYVIYYISDKAENVIIQKFGRFIGVTQKDVERISTKLNSGKRDDLVLFLLIFGQPF